MKYTYKTQGTCSSHIEVEVEENVITNVTFWGGCNGNLQGISHLVKGMPVNVVLARLGVSAVVIASPLVRISCAGRCMKWGSDLLPLYFQKAQSAPVS